MFNFGLFASHVPYIAIVVAYIFYILTSFFSGEKSEFEENTESEAFVQHVESQKTPDYSNAYVCNAINTSGILKAPEVKPKLYFVIKSVAIITPGNIGATGVKILTSLFFRPPPSM